MKPITFSLTFSLATVLLLATSAGSVCAADADEDAPPKTIAEVTANADREEGLLTIFRDRKDGKLYLQVRKDQLGEELIYLAQLENGVVEAGSFRGAYWDNRIVTLQRHFDRVELVAANTAFWFEPDHPLARAADANLSHSVLAVAAVAAEDEDSVLLEADGIFLGEQLTQVKPTPAKETDPYQVFMLGDFNKDKSKIIQARSYPLNTDVEVEHVYSAADAKKRPGEDIADPRNVSIRIRHSFVALPDNNYQPRFDDPRVGYFRQQVTDLTSLAVTPYRDMITRWHLVKKDPSAVVSEPVEPITWWIENTTPLEYRELIRGAALAWNSSFEKAGFANAIEVRTQPDDADWDAGDLRYNVLRWTSSPQPPFGGYGPSYINPRTGQIMGADVMLEHSFIARSLRQVKLLADQSLATGSAPHGSGLDCSLGHGLQINSIFGLAATDALGGGEALKEQIVHDTMHYLILHELGHTLGLNHNMKATQLLSADEAFDPSVVAEKGLAGSVMDYPAFNFAPPGKPQTLFYSIAPGPYDDWAIEFGYSPAMDDPEQRAALLARSTEPQLAFGNDADDMRAPGKGIDPRINIYDMSSDGIGYAIGRFGLLRAAQARLLDVYGDSGESWQELYNAYLVMMQEWQRSAAVISRYVGGVYLDRAMAGQPGGGAPYTPVPAAEQSRAMQALAEHVFAPDAFVTSSAVYRYLAQQRRGFGFMNKPEDPPIHDWVTQVQKNALDHLLHPNTLKRLTDSALYGNEYRTGRLFGELTDAVFAADLKGPVNGFRRNLQTDYVNRLAAMVAHKGVSPVDPTAAAMAAYTLKQLAARLDGRSGGDVETQAHRQNLLLQIERALATGV